MKYDAVIFDLDGTLLDSLKGIAAAMNELLAKRSYPLHSLDKYKYFVGEGLKELVRRALPPEWYERFRDPEQTEKALDEMVVEYRNRYDEIWPQTSPPYSGIPELLEILSRENIKMGVLSNKADDFTKRMTLQLLPGIPFVTILGARPGVPGKPDPSSALEIAAVMGMKPGEIVFLGDTGVDMQTAVNAGMVPVGALWGFRQADELLANGARQLLKHPLELTGLMNCGNPHK